MSAATIVSVTLLAGILALLYIVDREARATRELAQATRALQRRVEQLLDTPAPGDADDQPAKLDEPPGPRLVRPYAPPPQRSQP